MPAPIKNRGSVLLMAVGLLTILALLGTGFLIVAGINRRTAAAAASQGQMDTVAKSALAQMVIKIQTDVPLNDSTDIARVYDFPDPSHAFLSEYDPTTINTAGDGTLVGSGMKDGQDNEYQVASKGYDAGGMLNANWAGAVANPAAGTPFPITYLGLDRFLGDVTIAQNIRSGATTPYGMDDMLFLVGGDAATSVTTAGRLRKLMDSTYLKKDGMTTRSVSRFSLLTNQCARAQTEKADLNTASPVELRDAFYNMLEGMASAADRDKVARIMALRVVDFRGNGSLSTDTIGARKYFGVIRQPFISKAAYYADDTGAYYALELMNPYVNSLPLAGYRLRSGSGAIAALAGTIGGNGGRAVFVSRVGKIAPSGTVVPSLDLSQRTTILGPGDYPIGVVNPGDLAGVGTPPTAGQVSFDTIRRDDTLSKAAYSVAMYSKGGDPTTVNWGGSNGVNLANVAPCPVYVRNGQFLNVGDLMRIYWAEVSASTADPFDATPLDVSLALRPGDINNGRLDMALGGPLDNAGASSIRNPKKVPVGCKATEYFIVKSDQPAKNYEVITGANGAKVSLIYGRVNINTAPASVLKCLPGLGANAAIRNAAATAIVAYRGSNGGFKAAGEIALALGNNLGAPATYGTGDSAAYAVAGGSDDGLDATGANRVTGDLFKQNCMYAWMSNHITVSSEVFVVYIRVQNTLPAGSTGTVSSQRYVAVIDRSRCTAKDDRPAVLMFAQIPAP